MYEACREACDLVSCSPSHHLASHVDGLIVNCYFVSCKIQLESLFQNLTWPSLAGCCISIGPVAGTLGRHVQLEQLLGGSLNFHSTAQSLFSNKYFLLVTSLEVLISGIVSWCSGFPVQRGGRFWGAVAYCSGSCTRPNVAGASLALAMLSDASDILQ